MLDPFATADPVKDVTNLGAPIQDRLQMAMRGWGHDADAMKEMSKGLTEDEARGFLQDDGLLARMESELSNDDFIEVMKNNRARVLYERLGFRIVATSPLKFTMQFNAAA